ncbi:unnamed protein product, partial [Nesidiocoris tenuis]
MGHYDAISTISHQTVGNRVKPIRLQTSGIRMRSAYRKIRGGRSFDCRPDNGQPASRRHVCLDCSCSGCIVRTIYNIAPRRG